MELLKPPADGQQFYRFKQKKKQPLPTYRILDPSELSDLPLQPQCYAEFNSTIIMGHYHHYI